MGVPVRMTGAWEYNNSTFDEVSNFDSQLADWIVEFLKEHNITNLFDFGCSTGYYLKHISDRVKDMNLIGVEPGVSDRNDIHFDNILSYDLALPFSLGQKGTIICLEVLEHIPPQYESNAIDNIVNHCSDYLLMSWATPGQGGYGHFNEKSFEDVISLFKSKGFELLGKETKLGKEACSVWWLRNNFAVFKKI